MLAAPDIQKLMREVAAGIFPAQQLLEVRSEAASDPYGDDALRITLVLTDEAAQALTGDQSADLLMEIHDSLQRLGDERFPVLHYATPSDAGLEDEEEE